MRFLPPLLSFLLLSGCTHGGILGNRGTITETNTLHVKTTAYTGVHNAVGVPLNHGKIISAAADWSQFPIGTQFSILGTSQKYEIDDYGPALVGSRTIDLCASSRREMKRWGVRWVDIQILEWGSPRRSLEVLTPREKNRTARRMILALRRQTKGVPQQFHRLQQ